MSQYDSAEIAVLILAAGSSSRMGQPKQLLPWKGDTLLDHSIKTAKKLTKKYIVVLGAYHEQICPLVPEEHLTVNTDWKKGMGSSIAHGIEVLEERFSPNAVLIKLVDQPELKLGHYEELFRQHQSNPSKIICTAYVERNGVPALLPKKCFPDLKKLDGDFGARKLLNSFENKIISIEPIGMLSDLDTPEDYDHLLSSVSQE